jgi:hypothetical protein
METLTLLRNLGNYQSIRRNIRETAPAWHLRQNLMKFHFPKLRMCLMKQERFSCYCGCGVYVELSRSLKNFVYNTHHYLRIMLKCKQNTWKLCVIQRGVHSSPAVQENRNSACFVFKRVHDSIPDMGFRVFPQSQGKYWASTLNLRSTNRSSESHSVSCKFTYQDNGDCGSALFSLLGL